MPVILQPDAFEMWLDSAHVDPQTASALLAPSRDDLLEAYEISPGVNRVANDSQALIEPLPQPLPGQALPGQETPVAETPAKKAARKVKEPDGQASLF